MAFTTEHLGRLDLASTRTGLKLQLSSLAQFAPSTKDVPLILTTQKADAGRPSRPWIKRASTFRLVVSIRVADEIEDCSKAQLAEELATDIRRAKARLSSTIHKLIC
jgi:hypothetical protein